MSVKKWCMRCGENCGKTINVVSVSPQMTRYEMECQDCGQEWNYDKSF